MSRLRQVSTLWARVVRGSANGDIEYRPPVSYFTTIGGAVGYGRRSDVSKLKDLRRRLDSGQCTLEEIDAITIDVMDESAEVSHLSISQARMTDKLARFRLYRQHGDPKAVRAMFSRTPIGHAPSSGAKSGSCRGTQERYLGRTKDYRMQHHRRGKAHRHFASQAVRPFAHV